jgi:ferredoxin-NADP reductase
MAEYIVHVLETEFVTHNVKRFKVERPQGYSFESGQATDLSINHPDLKHELRPFTFTSINASDHLEFTIKIYRGHNGITEKLGEVRVGDELILHDVFGTITYHGPGLFIAAGAGITPFISIFRQLKVDRQLNGNTLLFANRSVKDIILKDEFEEMLGENFVNILEEQEIPSGKQLIDKELLSRYRKPDQYYYICGPDKFTELMVGYLHELGINNTQIIIEQ